MTPRISILLCTFNGRDLVGSCLESILRQSIREIEVLCIDGGSRDGTLELIQDQAARDPRVRLIHNPNRLPEGHGNGKWLGFEQARGSLVGIVDQDNVLQRDDLFEQAIHALEQDPRLLGVLGGLRHDRRDPPIVRYISLFGTDAFFAYRSVDFLRWTRNLACSCAEPPRGHEPFELSTDNLPLTGGNCFFYRKSDVLEAGGYDQDVLLVRRLVSGGRSRLAMVPDATKHYAERGLTRLVSKKFFWAKTFFTAGTERFDYLPRTALERRAFARNLIFNLLIVPNLLTIRPHLRRTGDPVCWLFPPIAFLTTIAYGLHFLAGKIRRS
jgi:glycosyltransferase involved in cell wall biosynthesis